MARDLGKEGCSILHQSHRHYEAASYQGAGESRMIESRLNVGGEE